MTHVDLAFKLSGSGSIPSDHGYVLYGALSRIFPLIHEITGLGIHPIRGVQIGKRQMAFSKFSRLIVRVGSNTIPTLLPLSGKTIQLAGTLVRIGTPEVHAIKPAATLRSRLVTIKLTDGEVTSSSFLNAVREQLAACNVLDQAIPTIGRRRTLRIKDKEIVGYGLVIDRLPAKDSLILLESGLGGRRKMGCGLFVPTSSIASSASEMGSIEG